MERPFALRELLLTAGAQEILNRDEFSGVPSHRKTAGASIALDIQRNFKFPGDDEPSEPTPHTNDPTWI